MKLFISILLFVLVASTSSFNTGNSSGINPKIESYFNSLDLSKKQESNDKVLNQLKNNIELSDIDDRQTYLLSGDNADALAFTQVIILTWLKEKKFKKVDLIACSPSLSISDEGLKTLKEIGYGVEYNDGQYNIQYAEKEKPLKLSMYPCDDKKAKQNFFMKLWLGQGGSVDSEMSAFNYTGSDSKEMFKSLATDLYSMIKVLKK